MTKAFEIQECATPGHGTSLCYNPEQLCKAVIMLIKD